MNVPNYLTIERGLVHFGSEVRKISYTLHVQVGFINLFMLLLHIATQVNSCLTSYTTKPL